MRRAKIDKTTKKITCESGKRRNWANGKNLKINRRDSLKAVVLRWK